MSSLRANALQGVVGLCLLTLSLSWLAIDSWSESSRPLASARSPQGTSFCPGDTNLDGERDIRDLVLLRSYLLRQRDFSAQEAANADINRDTLIDVRDMVGLMRDRLGLSPLPGCDTVPFDSGPRLRAIAPRSGSSGTRFTLIGTGFSNSPGRNTLTFFRPDRIVQAPVLSADENRIVALVPDGLEEALQRVTVTVDAEQSNGIGFEVTAQNSELAVAPEMLNILLPPGRNAGELGLGGGTPPYLLMPIDEVQRGIIEADVDGSSVLIRALKEGTVNLNIEDSASPPARVSAVINILTPRFEPTFDVIPHNLLAGSSPGFTLRVGTRSDDLVTRRVEVRFRGVQADYSALEEGSVFAIGNQSLSIFIEGGLPAELATEKALALSAQEKSRFDRTAARGRRWVGALLKGDSTASLTDFNSKAVLPRLDEQDIARLLGSVLQGQAEPEPVFPRIRFAFPLMRVVSVDSPARLRFGVLSLDSGIPRALFDGLLRSQPNVMELEAAQNVPAGSVVFGPGLILTEGEPERGFLTFEQEFFLSDQIFSLPENGSSGFEVSATFTSVDLLAGEVTPLTRTVTHQFQATAAPGPSLEGILPVLGPVGRLVSLTGSGLDPVASNNIVTFSSATGGRIAAPVREKEGKQLLVQVPSAAVTGPVRVQVGGEISNDHQFFGLFTPRAEIAFQSFSAGVPTGPLLSVNDLESEVRTASAHFSVDSGALNLSGLELDQVVGKAILTTEAAELGAEPESFNVVYLGEREDGHLFELRAEDDETSQGSLLVAPENGGIGIDFVLADPIVASRFSILFEEGIYVPPGPVGTTVQTRVEVRSVIWNPFPDSEMVVVLSNRLETR